MTYVGCKLRYVEDALCNALQAVIRGRVESD